MAKCNQLTLLPFKGLKSPRDHIYRGLKNNSNKMFAVSGGSRLSLSVDAGTSPCYGQRTVWKLVDVGVPVLVVDSGDGRRRRQLHVVLADPPTGFPRWRQTIDHLTDYRSAGIGLHTLRQSADHARLAALNFDHASEAARFLMQRLRLK